MRLKQMALVALLACGAAFSGCAALAQGSQAVEPSREVASASVVDGWKPLPKLRPPLYAWSSADDPRASFELSADGVLEASNLTPEAAGKIAAEKTPLTSLPPMWGARLTCVYLFSVRVAKTGAEWTACVGYGQVVEKSSGVSTSAESHRFFLAMADEYRRQCDALERVGDISVRTGGR